MIRKLECKCKSSSNCSYLSWEGDIGSFCSMFGRTPIKELNSLVICNKVYGETYTGAP